MIAFLDGGTTQTRLRVWDGQRVLFEAARPIGTRTSSVDGRAESLPSAVAQLTSQARQAFALVAAVASGMLSSLSG